MIDKRQIETLYRNKKYTIEETANKLNVSFWTLYNSMEKYGINRRNRSEAGYNYNRIKPQFDIKPGLSFAEEKLKVAGIMLYWAEGTLKGNTVDFANSNPEMLRIFLEFLRQVCGVAEKRLRVYLYAYSHHNIDTLKNYWHNITKISITQFTKPYVRRGNPNKSNRKLPHGLIHIRYNDKKLLKKIECWIKEYSIETLKRAGTQAAKGGRLSKAASHRKTGWKSR